MSRRETGMSHGFNSLGWMYQCKCLHVLSKIMRLVYKIDDTSAKDDQTNSSNWPNWPKCANFANFANCSMYVLYYIFPRTTLCWWWLIYYYYILWSLTDDRYCHNKSPACSYLVKQKTCADQHTRNNCNLSCKVCQRSNPNPTQNNTPAVSDPIVSTNTDDSNTSGKYPIVLLRLKVILLCRKKYHIRLWRRIKNRRSKIHN